MYVESIQNENKFSWLCSKSVHNIFQRAFSWKTTYNFNFEKGVKQSKEESNNSQDSCDRAN